MSLVCLVITTDGSKVPFGLWLGDTENKTRVTALLADLVARWLSTESGVFFAIDGTKALAVGIKKVLGEAVKVQRCVLPGVLGQALGRLRLGEEEGTSRLSVTSASGSFPAIT